jgi:hypothetical protein
MDLNELFCSSRHFICIKIYLIINNKSVKFYANVKHIAITNAAPVQITIRLLTGCEIFTHTEIFYKPLLLQVLHKTVMHC